MFLTGEIHNLLRGLAAGATAIPPGEFRDGYEAALVAVGLSCGIDQSVLLATSRKYVDRNQTTFHPGDRKR
jgi:hypothetical protein